MKNKIKQTQKAERLQLFISHYQMTIENCKTAMQQSNPPLRVCNLSLTQRGFVFPDGAKAMEHYTVALQQVHAAWWKLQAVLNHCMAVLQQGTLKFRNCKTAFPKLQSALRHCLLNRPHYKPALLLCIHSPPFSGI